MQAGRLRHRVTLQVPTAERTDSGAFVDRFSDWLTVWASVEPMTPRELFAAAQVQSDINTKIRLRWRPGLNAKIRVKHVRQPGSPSAIDYYDVEGPPIEQAAARREIWLMCKKRDAEGFRTGPV